jgi:hypothetical protein
MPRYDASRYDPPDCYSRENHLRQRLNTFLAHKLKVPAADYYSALGDESLLSLKSLLADINNIFTLRICFSFVDWLAVRFKLEAAQVTLIRSALQRTKPSANGFDVHILEPIQVVAEAKCNLPINAGTKYGSAQRKGIEKDVGALLGGKLKARVDISQYLKFLVLLDHPSVKAATEHLQRVSTVCRDKLLVTDSNTTFNRHDVVYVVYVRSRLPTPQR